MKKKRVLRWLMVLVLVAAAAAYAVPKFMAMQTEPRATSVSAYTVGHGDVAVTITGSGMLEVKDTLDVMLPDGVEVAEVFAEQGDLVQQGDVLAVLDTDSLTYRAAELSSQLTALDKQLSMLRLKSAIHAPAKGRIKYLPVAEDDDVIETVNKHGALAILSTDELMQVEIETDAVMEINAEVKVKWNGGSEEGTVVSRTEKGYLITLSDQDAPYQAEAAVYYEATQVGTGVIDIHAPLAIFGNGGTIADIHYDVDDQVALNAKLFTLDNEPATDDYRKAMADRQDVAEQLQTVLKYQNQPNILAEKAGTVNEVLAAEGKKMASQDGSGEAKGFVLGVGGAVVMTVDVDELDVNKVAVGQKATVTLDAFSSETFEATVTRISYIGQSSGSITTYATDLELAYDERLRVGMNGSAVIQSDHVENVVIVPLGAVHEDADGAYVYLLDDMDQQEKCYITTGLSDGSYAEVCSGLHAGDRIVYSQQRYSFMMPMSMMNSPMGGMLSE